MPEILDTSEPRVCRVIPGLLTEILSLAKGETTD